MPKEQKVENDDDGEEKRRQQHRGGGDLYENCRLPKGVHQEESPDAEL